MEGSHINKDKRLRSSFLNCILSSFIQTTFEDGEYNVVFDKGTLDAIYSDGGSATLEEVKKMFFEINRVLRVGGRYICVTLAQEHILHSIVEHFQDYYFIRIHSIQQNNDEKKKKGLGSRLPIFVFVLTKMPRKCKYFSDRS